MTAASEILTALAPTPFIDSDAPAVIAFARQACHGEADPIARAVRLYYAVRDGIVYTPYCDFRSPETYRASATLARGSGFCVAKAALLAAAARSAAIPARIGFADVRNHLTTPRLRAAMGTDVFYYHGYTELRLDDRWVKATPAFDRGLCDRFGVRPLEFDGRADSLFHPFDRSGRQHLEYVADRGLHVDVPIQDIVATFEREYPGFFRDGPDTLPTRFRAEAEQASRQPPIAP
jgi:transglutaminase-like putative cysteine protease